MRNLMFDLKNSISSFYKTDNFWIINFHEPYSKVFDSGNIKVFSNEGYNISIYNQKSLTDYSDLNNFAIHLSELYGFDQNNYIFDETIEDPSIRYSLCFDFDSLYNNKAVTLILEFWNDKVCLNLLGCENVLPLKEFLSEDIR